MWVDRVAAVGPGSARSQTPAFDIGGCVTLPSDVGAAVHAGSVELDVFAGISDDGVEVDSVMASPNRESRPWDVPAITGLWAGHSRAVI